MSDMDNTALKETFKNLPGLDTSADALQYDQSKIHWKGLVGSAKVFTSSALAEQVPGHHLFVLQD